eukprot:664712-Prorocentrum_minimum.AAC.1
MANSPGPGSGRRCNWTFASPPAFAPRRESIQRVYSHDGPVRRRKRRYTRTTDLSDAGSAGIFSRRTNQTQKARVYYHDGPIGRRKR